MRYPGGAITYAGAPREPMLSGDDAPRCVWSSARMPARDALPINCVDWATAMAFCVWDGGRLPTNVEYEYTLRYRPVSGVPSPREFFSGDEPPDVGPVCEAMWKFFCTPEFPAPAVVLVGSYPAFGGFYDLFGNTAELVADAPERYTAACWRGGGGIDPVCDGDGTHRTSAVRTGGSSVDIDAERTTAWHAPPWLPVDPTVHGLRCAYAP